MPRVIHTGQALVDYVLDVPELPVRGGNVYASAGRRSAGGAVNILVAAARNGAHAVHAGAHGTGENGDLIRATLARDGVELCSPPVPNVDSGICICLLEHDERTFVTTRGAERRISECSLQRAEPVAGDVVCVDGYTLVAGATVEPMLAWLEGLPDGVEVVLDPAADFANQPEEVRRRAVAVTTVWTSNLDEAADICAAAGVAVPASLDMAAAAGLVAGLLAPGAVSIVRDGPNGCAVRVDGVTTAVAGFPQRPVDTNGAGDAHTGVLVAARLAGAGWGDAARRANAAAAIKVTRMGPATAPGTEEIDAWLATGSGSPAGR
ncbi:PfkB family carbohydrate kinase [Cumulibacter manganitolerans]|uniref:PfkB family carbohydrate kinase n=1 Tax=Cumulibacter manganitolerans TaxID=1884992 RepID=UPI0012962425|nr:PfkB family carbohydrate kinase [Cumulibacter manganitolerans]